MIIVEATASTTAPVANLSRAWFAGNHPWLGSISFTSTETTVNVIFLSIVKYTLLLALHLPMAHFRKRAYLWNMYILTTLN